MSAFSWDQVQIFRCSTCGKWSHAKKQPTKHHRWVREGDPDYDPMVVGQVHYDHMNGFSDTPPGHHVDCGPFVPFVASPGRLR